MEDLRSYLRESLPPILTALLLRTELEGFQLLPQSVTCPPVSEGSSRSFPLQQVVSSHDFRNMSQEKQLLAAHGLGYLAITSEKRARQSRPWVPAPWQCSGCTGTQQGWERSSADLLYDPQIHQGGAKRREEVKDQGGDLAGPPKHSHGSQGRWAGQPWPAEAWQAMRAMLLAAFQPLGREGETIKGEKIANRALSPWQPAAPLLNFPCTWRGCFSPVCSWGSFAAERALVQVLHGGL